MERERIGEGVRKNRKNVKNQEELSAVFSTESNKSYIYCNTFPWLYIASFPGLSCFYLPFAFAIIHRSGRLVENREGLGAFIT